MDAENAIKSARQIALEAWIATRVNPQACSMLLHRDGPLGAHLTQADFLHALAADIYEKWAEICSSYIANNAGNENTADDVSTESDSDSSSSSRSSSSSSSSSSSCSSLSRKNNGSKNIGSKHKNAFNQKKRGLFDMLCAATNFRYPLFHAWFGRSKEELADTMLPFEIADWPRVLQQGICANVVENSAHARLGRESEQWMRVPALACVPLAAALLRWMRAALEAVRSSSAGTVRAPIGVTSGTRTDVVAEATEATVSTVATVSTAADALDDEDWSVPSLKKLQMQESIQTLPGAVLTAFLREENASSNSNEAAFECLVPDPLRGGLPVDIATSPCPLLPVSDDRSSSSSSSSSSSTNDVSIASSSAALDPLWHSKYLVSSGLSRADDVALVDLVFGQTEPHFRKQSKTVWNRGGGLLVRLARPLEEARSSFLETAAPAVLESAAAPTLPKLFGLLEINAEPRAASESPLPAAVAAGPQQHASLEKTCKLTILALDNDTGNVSALATHVSQVPELPSWFDAVRLAPDAISSDATSSDAISSDAADTNAVIDSCRGSNSSKPTWVLLWGGVENGVRSQTDAVTWMRHIGLVQYDCSSAYFVACEDYEDNASMLTSPSSQCAATEAAATEAAAGETDATEAAAGETDATEAAAGDTDATEGTAIKAAKDVDKPHKPWRVTDCIDDAFFSRFDEDRKDPLALTGNSASWRTDWCYAKGDSPEATSELRALSQLMLQRRRQVQFPGEVCSAAWYNGANGIVWCRTGHGFVVSDKTVVQGLRVPTRRVASIAPAW